MPPQQSVASLARIAGFTAEFWNTPCSWRTSRFAAEVEHDIDDILLHDSPDLVEVVLPRFPPHDPAFGIIARATDSDTGAHVTIFCIRNDEILALIFALQDPR